MNVLLAFPRTASTWTRYMVENFSGKTCDGYYDKKSVHNTIMDNNFTPLYGIPTDDIFLTMVHYRGDIRKPIGKIAVSFRDPVEVLPSFHYSNNHKNKKIPIEEFMKNMSFKDIREIASKYKENLDYYRSLKSPKMLVNYENLMAHPEEEIKRITTFFNCFDEEKMNLFMNNYEEHKRSCLTYKSLPKHMSVNTLGANGVIKSMIREGVAEEIGSFFKDLKELK